MKFMLTWTFPTGSIPEAADRFLKGVAAPEAGVTVLGRWHAVDCSGGFALYETSDPIAIYKGTLKWADLMEFSIEPVLEDGEIGPALAERFKK